jgi:PD-(D/E)XK nuclease superfamily protein
MTNPKDWKNRKRRKPKIPNKKLRGEWAEMVFMTRAIELGLPISKPWGEMRSFDFVVGRTRHFVSVQVKSTILESESGNAYVCTVRGGHKPYPPGSFDFLAAYVVDENAWYIIPEEETWDKGSVTLHPNSPKAKYEEYREAWHLLDSEAEPTPGRVDDIQGCAEEPSSEWIQ